MTAFGQLVSAWMHAYEPQQGRPSWMTEVLETQDAVSSDLHQIKNLLYLNVRLRPLAVRYSCTKFL